VVAQTLDHRRTTYDFILGGVDERVETAIEERDDDERVKYGDVDASRTHRYQEQVHLVGQVRY